MVNYHNTQSLGWAVFFLNINIEPGNIEKKEEREREREREKREPFTFIAKGAQAARLFYLSTNMGLFLFFFGVFRNIPQKTSDTPPYSFLFFFFQKNKIKSESAFNRGS